VGINAWRALRDVDCPHPAWRHLKGKPLTEEELPRGIEAVSGQAPATQPTAQAMQPVSAKTSAPAGCNGGACAGPRVMSELDDHGHPIEPEAL
ncbi:hypothetical protein DUNSADRAFT_9435, partial [Dunaliella salina]